MSQPSVSRTDVRTLDQRRAADALACLNKVKASDDERYLASYRSYVERLPATIVMNGLGQALAMECAAAGSPGGNHNKKPEERAHRDLYRNLSRWLCREDGGVYPGADHALEAIIEGPQSMYLRAQAEALAWLEWHKKFCQAHLPRREEE